MGLFGWLFGEGSKNSTSTSNTSTRTQDNRVGVEGGMAGQLVGPEAVLSNPGSFATKVGDFSSLTQTISGNKFKVGMTGAEVANLLKEQNLGFQTAQTSASETNAKLAALATTALSAQTGVPADWQKYIVPVGVLVAVVVLAKHRRKT